MILQGQYVQVSIYHRVATMLFQTVYETLVPTDAAIVIYLRVNH